MRGDFWVAYGLDGHVVVAVMANVARQHDPSLRLNCAMLTDDDYARVLSWARRELARGVRVAWLLADEMDDLA